MTVRVMLVSPASSQALREARFGDGPGDGEGLDAAGLRAARAAAEGLPHADRALSGPSPRCRGTARALGLRAECEESLADWDLGRWRGRTLAQLSADEPEAVASWLDDPATAPHGGETLLALCARVGHWLDALPADAGRVLVVAEPAIVRAATVRALALPPEAFWRLDVAPLVLTELSGRSERWNLRCGRPLTAVRVPPARV
ncbi:histidine phosphatase family protein [Streptomyces sp. NPDC055078]